MESTQKRKFRSNARGSGEGSKNSRTEQQQKQQAGMAADEDGKTADVQQQGKDPPKGKDTKGRDPKDNERRSKDRSSKSGYLSAYKRAQLTYNRLREERQAEAERQRAEREHQQEDANFQKGWRKKMNQALLLRTQRGQPNLNAQIGVLLEKLERDRNP